MVFLFKPCHNLGCAFAVEGHGNDGWSLIGGKVAALAVMGSVSKVEMATPIHLIYQVLFSSISTFDTLPCDLSS
jgi:hypothetical protein